MGGYFRASGNPDALEQAKALFSVIEAKCRDAGGYLEAFTADWQPESNEKLSENGVMATGWKEIDGTWEMFSDSGEWLYTWQGN